MTFKTLTLDQVTTGHNGLIIPNDIALHQLETQEYREEHHAQMLHDDQAREDSDFHYEQSIANN